MGRWARFAFNQANLGQNGEVLNINDTFNHQTVVLNLVKQLTHPVGYTMNLLTRQKYSFQFQNTQVGVELFNI